MQQCTFGAIFEKYTMNIYDSYDGVGSECKHIHYDMIHPLGYLTITLTIGVAFVTKNFQLFEC
jgi:hypothetical protein